MRIAIDARELSDRPTGVGRYLAEILRAWADLPAAQAHEFVLCAPEPVNALAAEAFAKAAPAAERLRISTLTYPGSGTKWEQLSLPWLVRNAAADVLFAPGYTGPLLCHVPMVVTIHDVSFAADPHWFSWREGMRRRALTRLAAQRACRVLTDSNFSKREIVERLHVDAGKIEVIYAGATQLPRVDRPSPGTPNPSILYVGTLFNRRHIPELIEAFARFVRRVPDARLHIVGENRTNPHIDVDALVQASGAGDRIRVRSYVSDEELAGLYGTARAFVFLSEYEGFGMTPLDALAAGIPIVVLDTPVAREIYGDAAVYVERLDSGLIDNALDRILFAPDERARVLEAARPLLARYSWHECAQKTLGVLIQCGNT
jgi:glycosyltransferase involved in cell wall biosynthesis